MDLLGAGITLFLFVVCSGKPSQDDLLEIVGDLQRKFTNLQSDVERLQTTIVPSGTAENKTAIGFYATRKESGSLGIHLGTIEFENVLENVGHGYDKRHGHFVAPVNGLYFFSATIYSGMNKGIHCEMVKDGTHLAALFAPEPGYASSTMSAIAQLNAGDMAWVRHAGTITQDLNANNYSSFVGFLIA